MATLKCKIQNLKGANLDCGIGHNSTQIRVLLLLLSLQLHHCCFLSKTFQDVPGNILMFSFIFQFIDVFGTFYFILRSSGWYTWHSAPVFSSTLRGILALGRLWEKNPKKANYWENIFQLNRSYI